MDQKAIRLMICLIWSTLLVIPFFPVYADDDHKENKWSALLADGRKDDDNGRHQKKKREHHQDGGDDSHAITPVNNSVYQTECGACHFAYQPGLLPESSWIKLLASLEDHFGEAVQLDADSQKAIIAYLKSNSADHNPTKRAKKIIKGIGNQVPLRITQLPYIIKEHHEISPDVFKRESIGSLGNCIACHTTAEDGIYDDDNVKIPK
jgi:hypothetical protein